MVKVRHVLRFAPSKQIRSGTSPLTSLRACTCILTGRIEDFAGREYRLLFNPPTVTEDIVDASPKSVHGNSAMLIGIDMISHMFSAHVSCQSCQGGL